MSYRYRHLREVRDGKTAAAASHRLREAVREKEHLDHAHERLRLAARAQVEAWLLDLAEEQLVELGTHTADEDADACDCDELDPSVDGDGLLLMLDVDRAAKEEERVRGASSRWLPSAGSMPESQPWGVESVGRQRPTLERCSAPAAARGAGSPSCLCE